MRLYHCVLFAVHKGGRGILAALFGLALVGAGEPSKGEHPTKPADGQAEITQALEDMARTLKDATKPDNAIKPCRKGEEDRNSELCAQWKAADAAAEAAEASWYQFRLGVAGLIVGLATLFAAVFAAIFARKAAAETEKGAAAALKAVEETKVANDIAKDTALQQLRPYLHIEKIEPKTFSKERIPISIKIRNFGQTPAQNVWVRCTWRRCGVGEAISAKPGLENGMKGRDFPPLHTQSVKLPMDIDDWEFSVAEIIARRLILVITVQFTYEGNGREFSPEREVIVYDHDGARQPHPKDNMKEE